LFYDHELKSTFGEGFVIFFICILHICEQVQEKVFGSFTNPNPKVLPPKPLIAAAVVTYRIFAHFLAGIFFFLL